MGCASNIDSNTRPTRRTIYDLVLKHNESLEVLGLEHEGAQNHLDYDVQVLHNEVSHLKKLVARGKNMELQNIQLKEERDTLMMTLKDREDSQNKVRA